MRISDWSSDVCSSDLSQARDRVADTTRITYITDDVNALRQEVARQQAAVRGLLLSGNRDYIGKYETAKAEYERRLASLQPRLTVEVARQQLTKADGEITRWQGDIVARQIGLMRNPLTVDEARVLTANGYGQRILAPANPHLNPPQQQGRPD